MMLGRYWSGLISTTPAFGWGCGTWGLGGGGRVGTLLGPEASGSPREWGLVVLVPPFALVRPCGCGGGLVGLLFEICIVDASIKYTFVVICFDVVETSYEGHMVDALASRADEGRRSLR